MSLGFEVMSLRVLFAIVTVCWAMQWLHRWASRKVRAPVLGARCTTLAPHLPRPSQKSVKIKTIVKI